MLNFDAPVRQCYYELASGVERQKLGLSNARSHATLGEIIGRMHAQHMYVPQSHSDATVSIWLSMFIPSRLSVAEAIGHGPPVVGFADCAVSNELVRPEINGKLVE